MNESKNNITTKARLVKSAIDIAIHIGKSIVLKPEGLKLYGKSPFAEGSDDRSLEVRSLDQRFSCKITGKWGDLYDWEREFAGTPFCEAVEKLATEYGTNRPTLTRQIADQHDRAASVAAFLSQCKPLGLQWSGQATQRPSKSTRT